MYSLRFPSGFKHYHPTSFLNRSDSNFLFKVDAPRGFFSGILEAGFGIFVLIIAIRFFNAPNYCKKILAGGSAFGLILSPLIMSFWSGSRYSSSNKCGILMLVTSTFIFLASPMQGGTSSHFLLTPCSNLLVSGAQSNDQNLFGFVFE